MEIIQALSLYAAVTCQTVKFSIKDLADDSPTSIIHIETPGVLTSPTSVGHSSGHFYQSCDTEGDGDPMESDDIDSTNDRSRFPGLDIV